MAEMEVGLMAGYMIAAGLARLAATDDALGEARREYDRAVLTEEAASREYLAAARETLGTDEARFEEAGHALKAAHEKHSQAVRALNAAEHEYLLALRDAVENEREARAMSNERIAAVTQLKRAEQRALRMAAICRADALRHFAAADTADCEDERYCQARVARGDLRASAGWVNDANIAREDRLAIKQAGNRREGGPLADAEEAEGDD